MPTIFDLVKSDAITAYWETLTKDLPPYLGDELFPAQQKLGLDIKWIKGSRGLPIALKPSAYDAKATKRGRIGFDKLTAQMPFFKESVSVDEEQRQQLNMVLETGNQAYIDSIMNNVFDDETRLLSGASATREQMRMMALTTGAISISANGQNYEYDYGMPATHKITAGTSWNDPAADIYGDIAAAQDVINGDTGITPTRAICGAKVWGYLRSNIAIRNGILGNNSAAPVSDAQITQYFLDNLSLSVVKYTKQFKDQSNTQQKFVADDIFTIFPVGSLGTGWFGTTPEQSDLLSSKAANVSITDTGVAVTTSQTVDPVNVDTKVSMIYLPSFEAADQVAIIDVIK